MFIILRSLTLLVISTLIITACGDGDTPASSSSSEAASTKMTAENQMPATENTQQSMTSESMPESETTPAVEAAAEETPSAAESVPAEATTAETPTSTAPVDGGNIYHTYCAICHKLGMNAAPKYGNKALWAKRIAQGRETVYSHALNGLRGMPPRGGFANLTDEEVKAGVDFMVRAAGGWQD